MAHNVAEKKFDTRMCSAWLYIPLVSCRFAPALRVVTYIGEQEVRSRKRKDIRRSNPDVVLTSYDMCLRDNFFFEKRSYNVVIVDEGHR